MNAPLRSGPIFVVGSARSGTTLLQRMLRSHPRISSPTGESHFIVPLYQQRASFGNLARVSNMAAVLREAYRIRADFLDTDLQGMKFDIDSLAREFVASGFDSIPKVISGLFDKNARGEGKARWLDKTPYYILHLPLVLEMFPDAQVIHVIRDGRDCALSMLGRRDDLRVYNMHHAAYLWQRYVNAGHDWGTSEGTPENYLEFRYEDMLVEPEATMRQVCEFLGEAFTDSVINFQKSTDPNNKTPLLGKSLQADNQGKWRSQMSGRGLRIFEGVAGDTLRQHRFELATDARALPWLLQKGFEYHNRFLTWSRQRDKH